MRVRTYLRLIRGDRSLRQVADWIGIPPGELSMFERGHSIPRADQAQRMLLAYGPTEGWYPPGVLSVLQPDLPVCPGCEQELHPDSARRRVYHGDRCRGLARRRAQVSSSPPAITKGSTE